MSTEIDTFESQLDYLLRFVAPIAPVDIMERGIRVLRAGNTVGVTWPGGPLVCTPTLTECVDVLARANGWGEFPKELDTGG